MSTKEDLSEKMNELLALEDRIDFSKLTKKDLENLFKVLGDPTRLIQIGVRQLRSKARKEILERRLLEVMDKPLIEALLERENKGPLGLGIIPRLRERKILRASA